MELKQALQNLGSFIENLRQQSEGTPKPDFEALRKGAITIFSSEGLGWLLLSEAGGLEYQNAANEVYLSVARHFGHSKTPDELHISKRAVESAIQSAILKSLDIPKQCADPFEKRLAQSLAELKTTLLENPKQWIVHIEVRGLAPDGLPHTFGQVEFQVSDGTLVSLRPSTESDSPPDKIGEGASKFADLFSPGKGTIYGTVFAAATDADAAKALAEKKLRLTLDALNFFGDFFNVLPSRVTLPDDAKTSGAKTFIFPRGTPTARGGRVSLGPTMFLPFAFALVSESDAKKSGFERVSAILANPSPTPLEERILSSIQWAGRASMEARREEAFLLFCISLEALLLGEALKTETTQRFALRGAHLLMQDATLRKRVFDDLKSLYGIRSDVAHWGYIKVTKADLSKMREFAKTASVIMLVQEPFSTMRTEKDLDDWFLAQLLEGVAPPSKPGDSEHGSPGR